LSISRYFRPRAERERTITLESFGIGSALLSSFRSSLALTAPVRGFCTGSTDSTKPTRTPPIRTSLPGTSVLAFGTCAETR
jgi:hypothetical protein